MKNSLKDFIRRNREDFDHRIPSEKVWRSVRASLKSKSGWQSVTLWRAAAVLFMGLSAYLFLQERIVPGVRRAEVASLQREFTDVESFYKAQIAEKVALIEDYENGYEDDHFTQDIQKLDAMYQVLREELKSKPSTQVKDALVLNMLVRVDLLNQQIKRLEESKPKKPKESSISI